MIPLEQEKLFKAARDHFGKGWCRERISGYVHGVIDGSEHHNPHRAYIQGFKREEPYALGYIFGFIDAYGADVFATEWCEELRLSMDCMDYKWWRECEIDASE